MSSFTFQPITRDNWEEVLKLSVYDHQKTFVPSPAESLAAAYVVPWDEAFDPYGIYHENNLIGLFYLSYTPDSIDNYWLGGFQIDKSYQGKGLGKKALKEILTFIKLIHPKCVHPIVDCYPCCRQII